MPSSSFSFFNRRFTRANEKMTGAADLRLLALASALAVARADSTSDGGNALAAVLGVAIGLYALFLGLGTYSRRL